MKKFMLVTLLAAVMMSLSCASAYGWGSITHAYIANELGREFGYANLQEMYGSTLPDMVNLKNIPPTEPYDSLYAKFHFIEPGSQEAIVNEAHRCLQKAFVFGFASHNDEWGADNTAHHDAAYIPGADPGYVSAKTLKLIDDLELVSELSDILIEAGVPGIYVPTIAGAVAPTVAEFGVETAVDFLIKRNEDPAIGIRLLFAAFYRSNRIPYMLVRAYSGGDLELAKTIIESEKEFREIMKLYGLIFLLEEKAAIDGIIIQWFPLISELAEKLYPGLVISEKIEGELIALGIETVEMGIEICEDDYYDEIIATIDAVEEGLEDKEIHTCPQW